ncbi:MAG TPA: hypothetical protein VM073_00500 [Usitatibacter sp.]|nr:hypothetical protein [Usitatibacter sp.]
MTKRAVLAVAAVAALVAGAWYALRPPEVADIAVGAPAVAAASPDTTSPPDKLAASAVLAIDPRPNPLRPARPAQVKATLFNEFLEAKQYRAIYDRLRGTPEGQTAEGRLVLYEVLRNCATITEGRRYQWRPPTPKREDFVAGLAASDPMRDRRLAAYDGFTANRCQGFEGITITQAELDRMLSDSAAAGDPRARAMQVEQEQMIARRTQGRDSATISDNTIETLKQVLSTKDPEAIRVAGRVLSNSWADYSLRLGPEQQPVEPRAFMNAWLVLACEYGQPCGSDTPRLQQACAFQGHCDAQNFVDYVYYYTSSPHDSQLLVQYRAMLREAIETGNWSQLSVVRGLPPPANRMNFIPGPR